MLEKKVRSYGSWPSPITSDLIVAGTVGLGEVAIDGSDVYWIESRPSEKGRNVIVKRSPDGTVMDITPPEFNARTMVHEYGGGAYAVVDGDIYFSNLANQRIYRQRADSIPQAITLGENMRYADGTIDVRRRLMFCVREDHTAPGRDCINAMVSLNLDGDTNGTVVASGSDFYSSPRISPDGQQLAWLEWNHPNLPWDGAELWVAKLSDEGLLAEKTMIAGGARESIFQPEWSPEGTLHFVSDRTGWWNLYRWRAGKTEPLAKMEAEFGAPQWVFRMSTYAFESSERIICAYNAQGNWRLASINTNTGEFKKIETSYTEISSVRASQGRAVFCGGSPSETLSVVELNLETGQSVVLRRSAQVELDRAYISIPESIEFPTEQGLKAHAFFYAPASRDSVAPPDEKPPLIVISHGGPTGATTTTLKLMIQYWASRGIGVLDVNYGGSTGYGRLYRERLNGQWGVVDVDDCINGARYLVAQGKADPNRLVIRGGSAGGYTTLAALVFRNFFKAGASYYGVSDLEILEQDCHKFESRYNSSLIGSYSELKSLYYERSPIHFTDRLSCPVILFQGLDDKVVPPNQSEMMFEAARAKGLPVAYIPFEGEGHGFRRAENIKRSLDAELYFYSKVFGFHTDAQPDESLASRFYNFP